MTGATLDQVREWYRLVDEGYKNLAHPIMAGSPDCPTCIAEGNLNRLFRPHLGLKLMNALEKSVLWDDHIRSCGECKSGTVFCRKGSKLYSAAHRFPRVALAAVVEQAEKVLA